MHSLDEVVSPSCPAALVFWGSLPRDSVWRPVASPAPTRPLLKGCHVIMVYSSHLQRAAPTGRSPFAAHPLDPFPPQAVVPIGLSPLYPSSSFPLLSFGRLCQRSPRTFPVSLLCVGSTQRRATVLAVGQVRPSGHPEPAVRGLSPTAAFGPWDVPLRGLFPDAVCASAAPNTTG